MIVYITSEIVILAYILDAEESNADILRGHSDMTSSIGGGGHDFESIIKVILV